MDRAVGSSPGGYPSAVQPQQQQQRPIYGSWPRSCCRCQTSIPPSLPAASTRCSRHSICRSCDLELDVQLRGTSYCPGCQDTNGGSGLMGAGSGLTSTSLQQLAPTDRQSVGSTPWQLQQQLASTALQPRRVNGFGAADYKNRFSADSFWNGGSALGVVSAVGSTSTDSCSTCRCRHLSTSLRRCTLCTNIVDALYCDRCFDEHTDELHRRRPTSESSPTASSLSTPSAAAAAAMPTFLPSASSVSVLEACRLIAASTSVPDSSGIGASAAIYNASAPSPLMIGLAVSRPNGPRPLLPRQLAISPPTGNGGGSHPSFTPSAAAAASAFLSPRSPAVQSNAVGILVPPHLADETARRDRIAALRRSPAQNLDGWLWQFIENETRQATVVSDIAASMREVRRRQEALIGEIGFRFKLYRAALDQRFDDLVRTVDESANLQLQQLGHQLEALRELNAIAAYWMSTKRGAAEGLRALPESVLPPWLRRNPFASSTAPWDEGGPALEFPSDAEFDAYLTSSCSVRMRVCRTRCSVHSIDPVYDVLSWTLVGRSSEFQIVLRDRLDRQVDDDRLTVLISDPHGGELRYEFRRPSRGLYVVRYRPRLTGRHQIFVRIDDEPIGPRSCYVVGVTEPFRYRLTEAPERWDLTSALQVPHDNLVKPYGVSWTPSHRQLLVADRDGHAVVIFDSSTGSCVGRGTGNFRRPTDVAVNSRGEYVVTDKDNHRVKIFSSNWILLRTIGSEPGIGDGQFRYPWGVAVNSVDQILVSDSKNFRVQMFEPSGAFVAMHSIDRACHDDRDGPRCVAFTPTDFPVVADFDMQRVLLLSPDLRYVVHVIGGQSPVPPPASMAPPSVVAVPSSRSPDAVDRCRLKGSIDRPRGVAVDSCGNIYVVQARNNRVRNTLLRFSMSGRCQAFDFDHDGCGVAVTPDGKRIAVVMQSVGVTVYDEERSSPLQAAVPSASASPSAAIRCF